MNVKRILKNNSPHTILNSVLNDSDVSVADFRALTMAVNKNGPFCYFKYNGQERDKEDILHQISLYQPSSILPKIMFGIPASVLVYDSVNTFLSNLNNDLTNTSALLNKHIQEIENKVMTKHNIKNKIDNNVFKEEKKAYTLLVRTVNNINNDEGKQLNLDTQKFEELYNTIIKLRNNKHDISDAYTILNKYVNKKTGILDYHTDVSINDETLVVMNETAQTEYGKIWQPNQTYYKQFALHSTMAIVFAIILYMASRRHKKNKRMSFARAVSREHREPIPPSTPTSVYDKESTYAIWIAHAYPTVHKILLNAKTPLQARIELTKLATQNYEKDPLSPINTYTSQYLVRTDGQLRDNLDEVGRAFYYFKKGIVSNTRATVRRIMGYRKTKKQRGKLN